MDYLFKIMMLIVVIPVVFLLFVFSVRHMPNNNLNYKQNFNGEKTESLYQIEKLCDSCLSKTNFERDCFLLKLNIKDGNISQDDLNGYKKYKIRINNSINLAGTILKGYSEMRISAINNTCRLTVLKQGND